MYIVRDILYCQAGETACYSLALSMAGQSNQWSAGTLDGDTPVQIYNLPREIVLVLPRSVTCGLPVNACTKEL